MIRSAHEVVRRVALAAAALLLPIAATGAQLTLPPKQVAAPPGDILSGRVRLPDPADVASRTTSALVDVVFDERGAFQLDGVPVGHDGALTLALLARAGASWDVAIVRADGSLETLADRLAAGTAVRTRGELAPFAPGVVGDRYDLHDLPPGPVTLRVTGGARARRSGAPDGQLVVVAATGWRLASHLADWRWTSGRRLPFVASIEAAGAPGRAVVAAGLEARIVVRAGGVVAQEAILLDDGRHADGRASDGVAGTWIEPLPPGPATVRVDVRGTAPDGSPLLLTSQHVFTVEAPRVVLLPDVETFVEGPRRLGLALGARLSGSPEPLHVSAEVWGTRSDGSVVPAAWLSTMVRPSTPGGRTPLVLSLDTRWLDNAGVTPPLELRAVRVQDPDTHVLLDEAPWLPVDVARLPPSSGGPPTVPTLAMLMGPGLGDADQGLLLQGSAAGQPAPQPPERALLLTHGYCSQGVWPLADFSGNLLVFLDPNANKSHDEFAQALGSLGASVFSHGVVGHSQGGPAALHLYTFYASGLDAAVGPRLIQAVGSPWQGTDLAGNLALLGDIFGAGCGVNNDMTPAGSALWLSTIPTWAREEVHAWTTSTGGLWCNFLTNLFLSNPNDGVVEASSGQLPGGNFMGHTTGWCHTAGMNDPAQYLDSSRNVEMDAQAAR